MKTSTSVLKNKRRHFDCVCDHCLEKFVRRSDSNNFSTCKKCSLIEAGKKRTTHGESNANSRLHTTWANMKRRCLNPTAKEIKNYASKKIQLDSSWFEYVPFRDWALSNGYSDKLTIDRIDNSGDYSPDNCRFVDYSTQNANKGITTKNKTGYIGVYVSGNQFSAAVDWKRKRTVIGYFKTAIDAAEARNHHICDNNLPHSINVIAR